MGSEEEWHQYVDALHGVIEAIAGIVGPTPIDRPELEARIEERAGRWATAANQGWAGNYKNWPMALGWAATMGLVCYGPGDRGRSTFVRLADWSGWREEDPREAGLTVLRHFLHAYGPSTVPEFTRWFALEPAIAKELFKDLSDELDEVDVDGSRRWLLKSDMHEAEASPEAVNLLPHFDVFVVGSHPREELMDVKSALAKASPGTAATFAVLLVGGRVGGIWERRPKGKRLLIRIDAYGPLNRRQRSAVEEQAERIGQILELKAEVEFGKVALRRHL